MGSLTRLLKDSGIYGLSSILARMINFLFVPLYTRELSSGDYGLYSEIFAYVALLQVVLTLGLETGFFRYASRADRDPQLVFSTLLHTLGVVNLVFLVTTCLLSNTIARLMGYSSMAVAYVGLILAIDSYTSILFARLRYDRKALKFAAFRTVKILSEVLLNLAFFFLLPLYFSHQPDSCLLALFTPKPSYIYILAAVACSSILSFVLFMPQIARTGLRVSKSYLREILLFSLPLMIAGLQGVSNDFADRVLFRHFSPDGQRWDQLLGIFSANAKLSVIMVMFVQVFRYAAEPLFFSVADQADSKQLYARATKYFTIFCVAIFLFVSLFLDVFQLILGSDFRQGRAIIPLMLLSNLLLGINQNLSMWYKLSGKTQMALLITFAGLLSTIIVNVLFMPLYGYYAAACSHLISYTIMLLLSWQLSKQYYRIPYQWGHITMYVFIGVGLYLLSTTLTLPIVLGQAVNILLLIAYLVFVIKFERVDVKAALVAVRSRFQRR